MSHSEHRADTRFQIGDRVSIIGAADLSATDFTGHAGTVIDLWEDLREYIVTIDGNPAPVIFPEASLTAAADTTGGAS